MGQIIPCRRFPRPRGGFYNLPRWQNRLQPKDIFLHRAVAHGIRAACPRGRHTAKRCICPRIHGKEQPRVAQMRVQRLARDTWLNHDIHILGTDPKNAVHLTEINTNSPRGCIHMPLKR